MVLPQRLLLIQQGLTDPHRRPHAGRRGRGAALLQHERPDGLRRRPGARGGPLAAARQRPAGRRVRAQRGQDGGHRLRPAPTRARSSAWSRRSWAWPILPRPDDAADALAIAICTAHAYRAEAAARMIVTLTGTVAAITADSLVLEVGGVGYRVYAGPRTLSQARVGAHQHLHTHHLVREDLQALYGFRSAEELGFFELLMTVTGVGPKVALAIVSSRAVPRPPAGHPAGRRGGAHGRQRRGQAARRAHHPGAQGEGRRGRPGGRRGGGRGDRGDAGGDDPGRGRGARWWRLATAPRRRARRPASGVLASAPGASLEDRVKAALRTLRRE